MTIEIIVAFIIGVLVGCVVMVVIFNSTKVAGVINIDRSDPDGPYLFLELSENISELSGKYYAKFRVVNRNYISPK